MNRAPHDVILDNLTAPTAAAFEKMAERALRVTVEEAVDAAVSGAPLTEFLTVLD